MGYYGGGVCAMEEWRRNAFRCSGCGKWVEDARHLVEHEDICEDFKAGTGAQIAARARFASDGLMDLPIQKEK